MHQNGINLGRVCNNGRPDSIPFQQRIERERRERGWDHQRNDWPRPAIIPDYFEREYGHNRGGPQSEFDRRYPGYDNVPTTYPPYNPPAPAPVIQYRDKIVEKEVIVYRDRPKKEKPVLPPPYPDEPVAAEGMTTCVICYERAPATIIKPCKHTILCVTCAITHHNTSEEKYCPMCKVYYKRIERVYN